MLLSESFEKINILVGINFLLFNILYLVAF